MPIEVDAPFLILRGDQKKEKVMTMEVFLQRLESTSEWTHGKLYINNAFECETLEDQHQDVKVMHETRIPAGRYEIKLRTFGGHHERYSKKFPNMHKGMLWLQNVPGFTDILIHIGNTDDDSSGCILVGTYFITDKLLDSTAAYIPMYKKIAGELEVGNKVFITIQDIA